MRGFDCRLQQEDQWKISIASTTAGVPQGNRINVRYGRHLPLAKYAIVPQMGFGTCTATNGVRCRCMARRTRARYGQRNRGPTRPPERGYSTTDDWGRLHRGSFLQDKSDDYFLRIPEPCLKSYMKLSKRLGCCQISL
jgi:hypothetical protein